ncbi:MAG: hypothetical protein R3B40_32515 [Polyangiales bacterium]|nr:hypothetical protein [Sandaracinaceae bacterium]
MSKDSPPDKREVARSLLLRGSMFVHLDPRVEGVVVPPWLRKQPQLVLQLGLDMVVPIVDLRIDKDGVYGTLSFNRSPFTCIVGWDAIFALAGDDGRGMVWPESMPPEILAEVEREAGRRGPVPLSAVADLEDDYDDYDDEDDDADERHAKGRPGNVIRLQPKLSALQGGLSPQAKPSPSTAPRPASVPAPPAPGTDGGVRERDTLELLELGSLPEDDSPSSTDEAPSAPEHASKAARSSRKGKRDAAPPEPPSARPSARPEPATAAAPPSRGDGDDEPEPPGPRGSHLRLIK